MGPVSRGGPVPDPLESINAEAEAGTPAMGPEGEVMDAGPSAGDRLIELFKPCPEDPLTKKGLVSQSVNGWLAKRSGVPVEEITVGENLAHCIDHLFPGTGMAGYPPIVGLARSIVAFRDAAHKNPDNGKLVRP